MICYSTNATLTGSGGTAFLWSPATYLNNARIASPVASTLTNTISYTLQVTDNNGCNSLKSDTIKITVVPPAIINAGRDTTLSIGQPLTLLTIDVNNVGFTQYRWSPSYGLDNPFTANPTTILDKDILYTVTASNSIGCTAADDIKIKVYRGPEIFVPNAFTPDGNGLNDILKVIPVGLKEFHFFRIYNRWGNIVFNTTNFTAGWDGKNAGAAPLAGTYMWIAEGVDYKGNMVLRKGSVILLK
jgi:gliding motility-associated-like protein